MKKSLILFIILMLSACSNQNTNNDDLNLITSLQKGDYSMLIPFQSSPVRAYHGTYLGRADFMEVGDRLAEKSKDHFAPDSFYLGEGQVLDIEELNNLVKRESSDNPYGLNPPSGSNFVTGVGDLSVLNAVVVADVVELDFYSGSSSDPQLAGLSFAIVLNDQLNDGSDSYVSVSQARLYEYGSDMGRKLERYIRTLSNMESIPVYIALYSTASIDSTLPGSYIGDGYFDGRSGQFQSNDERWTLFPSLDASSLDAKTDASFSLFKSNIQNFVPEAVGVIGQAHYVNGNLNKLNMTIHIQAKTYAEIYALVQYSAQLLKEFDTGSYDIIVKIESINDTLAMIQRLSDNSLSVIMSE